MYIVTPNAAVEKATTRRGSSVVVENFSSDATERSRDAVVKEHIIIGGSSVVMDVSTDLERSRDAVDKERTIIYSIYVAVIKALKRCKKNDLDFTAPDAAELKSITKGKKSAVEMVR